MTRSFPIVLLALGTLLTLGKPEALACRYSVRDTGFVDLGAEPYRLVLELSSDAPDRWRIDFEQAAAAVLLDANVVFSSRPATPTSPTRLTLALPDSRDVVLAEAPGFPDSRAAATAASAWRGSAAGAPNTASISSPMNCSTSPPWPRIAASISLK